MNRLKDKIAVVTGASLGIGKATAIMFAKEGAKVAVTDVLDEEGQAVVSEIINNGGEASYWHLDVAKESEVESVMKSVYEKWGGLNILVNNAGISGANAPTDEITEEEWNRVIDVNVKGVFFCTKHAIPYMKESGASSIINLSSIYGIVGAPDVPPYHASKGAVREMSKTDALLYAQENIRVNSVHPGFIWTPMVENHLKSLGGDFNEAKKMVDDLHPVGHMGDPDDIAYGIVYLASDESKFITGE
ncbi:MAG: glucose 1-dehydrogenase, partial [Fulvivirga sp.]|nr:glucose 1-dehydrogenase [Fulvivirga sp.]